MAADKSYINYNSVLHVNAAHCFSVLPDSEWAGRIFPGPGLRKIGYIKI